MVYRERTIERFTDLEAWRAAHQLALEVYGATRNFPREEMFGLTSQMRRAAVSVSSNIAEGFSRGTAKDKAQFYVVSKGSLTELESQTILAKDLDYIEESTFQELNANFSKTGRLLTGLLKYTSR